MKQEQLDSALLIGSAICFLGLGLSIPLMALELPSWLPGALFWAGLILGSCFQGLLELRRRAFFRHYGADRQKMQKRRNGCLSFFSGPLGTIADSLLVVSVAGTLLALILTEGSGMSCYTGLGAVVFFFCIHCILNGRIFVYVKNKKKIRRVLEIKQEKERESHEK